MSRGVVIQYAGFTSKPIVREYCFLVRDVSNEPREFTTERPQLEAEVLEGTDRGVGPKGFRDRLVGKAQFLVAGAVEDSRSFLVHRTGEL